MIATKKLPLALTVLGLGAAASHAEIKVTDNLAVSGFVDMSILGAVKDTGDATLGGSLDQYEMDFMYKFGFFSARADVNGLPADTSHRGSIFVEQAFVTAALTEGLSFSAGRFLSSSGFEAAEPTGLYQYSTSKTLKYGYYQNGVNIAYASPMFGIYAAAVTDLWDPSETELMNSPGFEGQVSLTPVEGVTLKATQLWQIHDKDATGDDGQGLSNIWAQYAKGAITAAAEFNLLEDWAIDASNPLAPTDASGMGWLAMLNYKVTDKLAATVRYSGLKYEDGDPDTEVTFSPSFAVSPNWLVLAEAKYEIDAEITNYAVESLFSF